MFTEIKIKTVTSPKTSELKVDIFFSPETNTHHHYDAVFTECFEFESENIKAVELSAKENIERWVAGKNSIFDGFDFSESKALSACEG